MTHELAIADFTKAIDATLIEKWQPYWWRAFSRYMRASFSAGDVQITEKELALGDANKAIELNPIEAMLYRNRALMHGPGKETLASADRAMGASIRAIYLPYELLPKKEWKPTGDPVDGSLSEAVCLCKNAMDLNSASRVPVFVRGWGTWAAGLRTYRLRLQQGN